MKKAARRVVLFLFGIVFIVNCAVLVRQWHHYEQGRDLYENAAELVDMPDLTNVEPVPLAPLPPEVSSGNQPALEPAEVPATPVDPYAEVLNEIDIAALQEVNEDVLGWIVIPDTDLSYPLLQGEDNDYYLNYTWQKSKNAVGSIFLDYRNSSDLSDFNSIVYGHRMRNQSMFGQLHKYQDEAYLKEHPVIYIKTDSGVYTYEIFSVYVADSMNTYQLDFADDSDKAQFIDYVASRTWIDTGVVPDVTDRIITLSTCTGNGHDTRWVIHAVLTN